MMLGSDLEMLAHAMTSLYMRRKLWRARSFQVFSCCAYDPRGPFALLYVAGGL